MHRIDSISSSIYTHVSNTFSFECSLKFMLTFINSTLRATTIRSCLMTFSGMIIATLIVAWVIVFVRARLIEFQQARLQARAIIQSMGNFVRVGPKRFLVHYLSSATDVSLNLSTLESAFRSTHIIHKLGTTRISRYVLHRAIVAEIPWIIPRRSSTLMSKRIISKLTKAGVLPNTYSMWNTIKGLFMPVA